VAKKKRRDIEDRIVSVEEAQPYVRIMVYGRNGAGKTRFAASGPDCLILDFNEEGTRSARGTGAKVLPISTWPDVDLAYWYLKRGDHDYKTVALDTITGMAEICMNRVLRESVDRDPNKDPKSPRRQDWGTMGQMMKEQLLRFRNLPMHVIFTAQERVIGGDEDEEEDTMHVPDLSGKPRSVAMGAVGIIGRIYQAEYRTVNKKTKKEASKWEDRLLLGPHEQFEGKDRTNELGRVLRNPTMSKVIEAWQASPPEEDEE
jgi:hypothetical protein